MLRRMRLIVDCNEGFLAQSLDCRNVDGHLAERGREGRIRGRSDAGERDEMRGPDDDRALDPTTGPHAAEGRRCHLTRVRVTGVRSNDAAVLCALLHRNRREEIVDRLS